MCRWGWKGLRQGSIQKACVCAERKALGRWIPLPGLSCGKSNLKRLSEWWQAVPKNKGSRLASGLQKGKKREEGLTKQKEKLPCRVNP